MARSCPTCGGQFGVGDEPGEVQLDPPAGEHLHLGDCPHTLFLLAGLFAGPWRLATEDGIVDWDRMLAGALSSTEVGVVHIARGCAALESAGGLPDRLAEVVVAAVQAVSTREPRTRRPPRWWASGSTAPAPSTAAYAGWAIVELMGHRRHGRSDAARGHSGQAPR